MSDFCMQCTTNLLGEPHPGDFAGMSTEEDTTAGLYPVVLCEGCGPAQVDHTGRCISVDCLAQHGVKSPP